MTSPTTDPTTYPTDITDADYYAKLVEVMIDLPPWRNKPDARVALAIASRAIRRGRHRTAREQLLSLADTLQLEYPLLAESLRREVSGH